MSTSSSDIRSMREQILWEGEDDFLAPWHLQRFAKRTLGLSSDQSKELLLATLAELLESGDVQAGDLIASSEFVAWPVAPSEAMTLIRERWDELESEPRLGDIAWFRTVRETPASRAE